MSTDYGKPIPIRLSTDLTSKIAAAATQHDKSNQEIMRLALDAGLELLRREGLTIGSAIVDAARAIDARKKNESIALVAEKSAKPYEAAPVTDDAAKLTDALHDAARIHLDQDTPSRPARRGRSSRHPNDYPRPSKHTDTSSRICEHNDGRSFFF